MMNPATQFLKEKIEPLRVNQVTHYSVCERYKKRHKYLGIALVAFSTISLAFTFYEPQSKNAVLTYLPIMISVLVAVLAAIIAFFDDSSQAMDHQSSAIAYGSLLRECEARSSGAYSEEENREFLPEFQARWESVSANSPLTQLTDRTKHERL